MKRAELKAERDAHREFEAGLRPKIEAEVAKLDEEGVRKALQQTGARLCPPRRVSGQRPKVKVEDLRKALVEIRLSQAWWTRHGSTEEVRGA